MGPLGHFRHWWRFFLNFISFVFSCRGPLTVVKRQCCGRCGRSQNEMLLCRRWQSLLPFTNLRAGKRMLGALVSQSSKRREQRARPLSANYIYFRTERVTSVEINLDLPDPSSRTIDSMTCSLLPILPYVCQDLKKVFFPRNLTIRLISHRPQTQGPCFKLFIEIWGWNHEAIIS